MSICIELMTNCVVVLIGNPYFLPTAKYEDFILGIQLNDDLITPKQIDSVNMEMPFLIVVRFYESKVLFYKRDPEKIDSASYLYWKFAKEMSL